MKSKTYYKYLLKPIIVALGIFIIALILVTIIYDLSNGFVTMITGGLIYVFLLMILPVLILFGTHMNSAKHLRIEDPADEPTRIIIGTSKYEWPNDFNKAELWMSHPEFYGRIDWSHFMNKYRYYLLYANDGKTLVLSQLVMDKHLNLATRLNAIKRKKLFNIPPKQLKNWA